MELRILQRERAKAIAIPLAAMLLLSLVVSLSPVRPVFTADLGNVKTGTCTIAALASSVSCTISPALFDTTKTLMIFQATSSDATPNSSNVRCYVAGTSTITCERNGTAGVVNIRWHTAEFSSGVTVQHLQPACTGGTTNVAITAVDMSKSFVLLSNERDGTSQGDDDFRFVRLTSSTNVEIVFSDTACAATEYALQVVEYDGASVTRGVTGAMGGASQPVSGLSSIDLTKTMLIYSYRTAAAGADMCERMVRGEITSATSITFTRGDGAGGCTTEPIDDIAWERVEFTDGTTVEEVIVTMAATVGTANVAVSAVDTSRTIALAGGQWANGQAVGEGSFQTDDIVGTMLGRHTLTTSTNLQVVRDNTGGTARWSSYVVQFPSPAATTFTDITSTANLGTSPGGGSIVIFDCNNDGFLDVYMNDETAATATVRLRQNDGDNTFTDRDSQITGAGLGRGSGSGDYDNDGDMDLVSGHGRQLFTNTGAVNCTFTNTDLSNTNPEALMFADVDGDGDLDIWSPGGPPTLWSENTGGGWVDQSTMPGSTASTGNGESATASDFNDDGFIDFLWDAFTGDNQAYTNDGDHTYTRVETVDTTFGLPDVVAAHENMEWAWGDCDNDDDLDLFVSGATNEGLYVYNSGTGMFALESATRNITIVDPDGADWGDIDNDGDLDLVAVQDGGVSHLYENDGSCVFTDVASSAGLGGSGALGKTAVFFDSDNDGDLDIVTNNPLNLWRNNLDDTNYLRVIPKGLGGASHGPVTPMGAQVTVREGSTIICFREVPAGFNQIQPALWQHCGLAPGNSYTIEVTFTSTAGLVTVTRTNCIPEQHTHTIGATVLSNTIEIEETENTYSSPCLLDVQNPGAWLFMIARLVGL